MKRVILFGVLVAGLWTAENWWLNTQQADLSAKLAINQFTGGNSAARELRAFQSLKDSVQLVTAFATLVAAVLLLGPVAQRISDRLSATPFGSRLRKFFGVATPVIVATTALLFTSGCIKSYDKPEYVEIDTSETGFLIPLEGDGTQQAKFQSEDYLKQRKVAAKRVHASPRMAVGFQPCGS